MKKFLFATLLVAIPMPAGPLSSLFSHLNTAGITTTVIDSANNVYVAGTFQTTAASSIPATPGAYLTSDPGCSEMFSCYHGFIAKISSSGALVFATYLGTFDHSDPVSAIALDGAGNVYIAGSSVAGVTTGSPSQPVGFIDRLSADGTRMLATYTLVGGSPSAIAVSLSGDVYATGQTVDPVKCSCQFSTTAGAFQQTSLGGVDAFVIRLDSSLSHPIYSTFLGGSAADYASAIAVDAGGNAYVTGSTMSLTSFPSTPGAYVQPPALTGQEVFVTKLNAAGSALIFSARLDPTFPNGFSVGYALAVDGSGVYVLGGASEANVPLSPNAFMKAGTQFLAKLAPDGSSLLYQTLLPGPFDGGIPTQPGLLVDGSGNALILGFADTKVPTTPNAFAPCGAGLYLLQLNSDASAATYVSYVPLGLAIRADGEVWYLAPSGDIDSFNIHDPLPPSVRCVADAFTGSTGSIAPGKLVTLIGPGIGPDVPATQQLDSTGKVAVGLPGVNVYFNGIAAPLISVSANLIEAVVPFENLDPVEFPTSTVAILKNGVEIDGPPVPVAAVAPALLTDTKNCVSGFNSDGTLNSSANPAALGSLIAIFGEGAGLMNPAITGGIGTGQSRIVAPVSAILRLAGTGAPGEGPPIETATTTLYAGDVPGYVEGLVEINLLLPKSFGVGQQGLQVFIGGFSLNACVWLKAAN